MLPTIPGLTETSQDAQPVHRQLMDVLARKSGPAANLLADGLAMLAEAARREPNEKLASRIHAGICMIQGMRDDDSGPDTGDEGDRR